MLLTDPTAIRASVSILLSTSEQNTPIFVAVAFWGTGCEALFPDTGNFRLICNLHHPGTNPRIIRQLATKHQFRHLPNLHAKTFVGTRSAVVGSANLSNAALAFSGAGFESWREAVILIEKPADDYHQTRNWLAHLWTEAAPVDEPSLASAEERWAAETGAPLPTPANIPPEATELVESQLFSPNPIGGRDRVRMASSWMNELFGQSVSPINPSNIRVPGFAANLLWTLAGKSIPTAIAACPIFSLPEQVIYRATDFESRQPRKNVEQLNQFISELALNSAVPPAVRHWAAIWIVRQQTRGDA